MEANNLACNENKLACDCGGAPHTFDCPQVDAVQLVRAIAHARSVLALIAHGEDIGAIPAQQAFRLRLALERPANEGSAQ